MDQAIREFDMIHDGERIAVALSGGKDSFTLLRLLEARRKTAPQKYSLVAIHVLGNAGRLAQPVPPELATYLQENLIQAEFVPLIIDPAEKSPISCYRCSQLRRKTLLEAARQAGCSAVAFGHHADDLAQTTLLNLLFHGTVETMHPNRSYFGGLIRIIRPLCTTPEKEIIRYARACAFPILPSDCPLSHATQRENIKGLLKQAEQISKNAKTNLLRAGLKDYWRKSQGSQE